MKQIDTDESWREKAMVKEEKVVEEVKVTAEEKMVEGVKVIEEEKMVEGKSEEIFWR